MGKALPKGADAAVSGIDQRVQATRAHAQAGAARAPAAAAPALWTLRIRPRQSIGFVDLARTLFRTYPQRATVAVVLMGSQAFFYNAISFTYALVLGKFFGVPADKVGYYLLSFAAGNCLGPLLLGRLFDTIGRRQMIAFTYVMSGILLAIGAALFAAGVLSAAGQTLMWTIVFFFASAAASSAYLTVGECYPLEIRALSISLFYALGTACGGADLHGSADRLIASFRALFDPVQGRKGRFLIIFASVTY